MSTNTLLTSMAIASLIAVFLSKMQRAEAFAEEQFVLSSPLDSIRSAMLVYQRRPMSVLGVVRNRRSGAYQVVSWKNDGMRYSYTDHERALDSFVTSNDLLLITDLREARMRMMISLNNKESQIRDHPYDARRWFPG